MDEYTKKEKEYLLNLARKAIVHYLNSGSVLKIKETELPSEKLKLERAVFVTLTQNGELRGCIGSLEASLPLYEEVIDKAIGAAFQDPRFYPITEKELSGIKIGISVLTPPEKLEFKNHQELLEKLTPLKDGVILKKGNRSATYLPEVWEQLPDKEMFLSSLCNKAGLTSNAWKYGIDVSTYQTSHFLE